MSPLVVYCATSASVNALTSLVLGLYVIATNRRSLASRTFFGFAMSVAFWGFCYTLWQLSAQTSQALFWTRALMAGAIFIPTCFIHFVVTFLGLDSRKRRLVRFSYLFSAVLLISDFTPLFISGITQRPPFPFWPVPGPFFHPFLLHFAAVVIYAHYLMYRELRATTGSRRNQIRYVALGTFLGFSGGATNFPLWYNIPIPPIGNALVAVYVAMSAYAIARYRLLDINVALTRAILFAVVYVPLLLLPIIICKALEPVLTAWFGADWWLVPTVSEALFAALGLLAYRYVRQKAEDRILAEQRQYQQLLVAAAEEMLKILDLKKLLRRIVGIMVKYVRLQYAAIYLQEDPGGPFRIQARRGDGTELPETFEADDTLIYYLGASEGPVVTEELKRSVQEGGTRKLTRMSERLIRMKASVVIPAFLKESHMLGFLVLGPKLSGQMFTSDDLRTFNALAHQAAIAIQNARFHRRGVSLGKLEAGAEQLSAVGHEMGNVLHIGVIQVGTLIAGLQDSLEAFPKEKLVERLRRIEKALLRGHDVIQDLKAYQAASDQLGIHSFLLAQFLEEAVKKLKERFEDYPNIQVALNLPERLPAVEGLATLALLPLNLLAIPFWGLSAYPAGGTITVSVQADAQRGQVELSITDDTTDSLQKYVEDPGGAGAETFFPTRSRHGAFYYFVAKKIVSDHRGRLDVLDGASAEKGTTILVRLPVKYAPPKPEETEEESLGNTP